MKDEDRSDKIDKAISILKENSRVDPRSGKRFTTQEAFYKVCQETEGLSKEQTKAVSDAIVTMADAGARLTSEDLAEKIKEAKDNGDDPKSLVSETRMTVQGGKLSTTVWAETRNNNPRSPDADPIIKHGRVRVDLRLNKALMADTATMVRDRIMEAMG